MSLFTKNKNNEPDIVAIFDIGSGVVSVALVELLPNEKPVLLVSFSEEIISKKGVSFGELLQSTEKAIYVLGQKLLQARRSAPSKVYCFLSSPWYAGQTRIVKLSKQKEFTFTKKIWYDLLEKEAKRFVDETVSLESDAVLLEKKNMFVSLNGQKSMNPIDAKVTELELAVFFSMSSGNILNVFRHAIERSFSVPIEFSSFIFSSFITIRDLFHKNPTSSSLVVDIGSKVTEIGYVKNDVLVSMGSFPFGLQNIEHSIEDAFLITKTEAKSFIDLYIGGSLESGRAEKIRNLISKEIDTWYNMFGETFDSINANKDILQDVYVITEEERGSLFDFTRRMKILDGVLLPTYIVDGKTLSSYVRLIDVKDRNPFLMLHSLFITRL